MIGLEWSPTGKTRGTYFPPQWGDISRLTSGHPGQRPCLHAEVPAFGTRAFIPALTGEVFRPDSINRLDIDYTLACSLGSLQLFFEYFFINLRSPIFKKWPFFPYFFDIF